MIVRFLNINRNTDPYLSKEQFEQIRGGLSSNDHAYGVNETNRGGLVGTYMQFENRGVIQINPAITYPQADEVRAPIRIETIDGDSRSQIEIEEWFDEEILPKGETLEEFKLGAVD